ncbi:hypothetical protein SAMN05216299_10551 [Nitrosospira sp. Nsp14]|nr:hypothetical protein SAMN05216299_10551 [Nitrosospira sp. Nsp14]
MRLYGETFFGKEPLGTWERLLGIIPIIGTVHKVDKGLDAAKLLGVNPFKGKTSKDVSEMLQKKGYALKRPDPTLGRGTYVNPKTG